MKPYVKSERIFRLNSKVEVKIVKLTKPKSLPIPVNKHKVTPVMQQDEDHDIPPHNFCLEGLDLLLAIVTQNLHKNVKLKEEFA